MDKHHTPIPFPSYKVTGGGDYKKVYNDINAQGFIRKDQRPRVAFFGSSVSQSNNVSTKDTWPERLNHYLDNKYQIDNFSIGGSNIDSDIRMLEFFIKKDIKFKALIYQRIYSYHHRKNRLYFESYVTKKWTNFFNEWPYSYTLLKKWYYRNQGLNLHAYFSKTKNKPVSYDLDNLPTDKIQFDAKLFQILYKEGMLQERYDYDPDKKKLEVHKKKVQKFIDLTKRVTDTVIWIPENIAYSDDMKDSYNSIYTSIRPLWWGSDKRVFHSAKSQHHLNEFYHLTIENLIRASHFKVINRDIVIKDLLSQEEGLFIDEYHSTARGNDLYAKKMAQFIRPLL